MTKFTRNIIALVYDFDGTLTPQPMQEYTVFPKLGISGTQFWKEVDEEVQRTGGDPILTYMRLLTDKIDANHAHISRNDLRDLASGIKYYPGVHTWFDRINAYIKDRSNGTVIPRHYIISAGLAEILEGIEIKHHFERIYASQYYFNHHEVACFPTIVINDTSKTQYLFRINKGREDTLESINEHMAESERPIPFQNMVYIGDGMTDVPCMAVTKKYGGFSIAVHKPNDKQKISECRALVEGNRIDYYAPADYRPAKKLEKRVQTILDIIIAKVQFEREKFVFHQEMNRQR